MKTTIAFFGFIFISFMTHSCELLGDNNPQKIFDVTALESNKVPASLSKHFDEMRNAHGKVGLQVVNDENNGMKTANYSEYVNFHYVSMFDKNLENLEKLKKTEETAPIIDAALDLFQTIDQIYKTDFPRIAKMLDDDFSETEIGLNINELDIKYIPVLEEKKIKLMNLILPYADKHGIEYEVKELPW